MIFLGLSTASSSRLTERTKTLGEWFPLCHWALQCDAEQTQALLETINWFQCRLWHGANPCSGQQGVGALTKQGLGIQVKKEMKLEIAHSGSVVLSTAFQEAQEQHHDPQGLFKSKSFHDCPLLPSGLESEGLYRVVLPTTTAPEYQRSLAITCSTSRTGSAAYPHLNNAPRTKLKAWNHYKTGKYFSSLQLTHSTPFM